MDKKRGGGGGGLHQGVPWAAKHGDPALASEVCSKLSAVE